MKHLIIVSDLHVNSTVALSLPEVKLDDGGIYKASKSQLWLYNCWENFCSVVKKLQGEKIFVVNGDLIDINKHSQHQLITMNKSIIITHAGALLAKLVGEDKLFIIRGTSAHTGEVSEYEELLASMFGTVRDDNGNATHWELFIEVNETVFNIAHHGNIGTKPWTKTNPLNVLAASMVIDSVKNNQILPHVAIRSHLHTFGDTGDNFPVRVIQTPAWQLNTSYSYRIGANLADIGGLIFSCEDGKYNLMKRLYKPEQRKPLVV